MGGANATVKWKRPSYDLELRQSTTDQSLASHTAWVTQKYRLDFCSNSAKRLFSACLAYRQASVREDIRQLPLYLTDHVLGKRRAQPRSSSYEIPRAYLRRSQLCLGTSRGGRKC